MQSNEQKLENPNDPSAVDGLIAVLIESNWLLTNDKAFYKTLCRNGLTITLREQDCDFSLCIKEPFEMRIILSLPQVSKVYPFPIMALLDAYGIVDLKEIAKEHDIQFYDVAGLEAVVS